MACFWEATTPKAFIEDLASSGFCENKGLGGVLSLAGSENLTRRLCCSISDVFGKINASRFNPRKYVIVFSANFS